MMNMGFFVEVPANGIPRSLCEPVHFPKAIPLLVVSDASTLRFEAFLGKYSRLNMLVGAMAPVGAKYSRNHVLVGAIAHRRMGLTLHGAAQEDTDRRSGSARALRCRPGRASAPRHAADIR